MAGATRAASGVTKRLYEDFNPQSESVHEEGSHTLLIDLSGFKKEQLRVQLDHFGNLKVTGERPIGNETQWKRFCKDFEVPKDGDLTNIRAKFEDGLLYIIIPKLTTPPPLPPQPVSKPTNTDTDKITKSAQQQMQKEEKKEEEEEEKSAISSDHELNKFAISTSVRRKLVVNVVVASLVVVGLGIYANYRLRKMRGKTFEADS